MAIKINKYNLKIINKLDLILKTFVLLFIAAEQLKFRLTPDRMAGDEEHDGERDNVAMGLKLR